MNNLVVVRELVSMCGLLGGQPLQFRTLLTGCQYLPLYRLAEMHARPGMSVLDWGAGNGHFSYFLLRLGLEVTAFNFQSHKCALADLLHARFGARFRISYGPDDEPTRLPFADGSFDLAFSIGVLEHVRETGGSELGSLAELKRVLKPGGLLACGMLPKKYSWIEFLARHVPGRRHRHLYRYSGRDLGDLLSRSGFQLIELGTHGFLPRNSLNRPALGRLTGRIGVLKLFNLIDRLLSRSLPGIAQNFMFCARSATPSGSGADGRAGDPVAAPTPAGANDDLMFFVRPPDPAGNR